MNVSVFGIGYAGLVQGAALAVIVTEWQPFRAPDFELLARQLRQPLIFDGRNLYDPQRLGKRSFTYVSAGRLPQPRVAPGDGP